MDINDSKPELEHASIWRCKDPACKAWVREEYATDSCPLCKGPMTRTYKFLPVIDKKKNKKRTATKK